MKQLKELLGKSFKLVMFLVFTIFWALFVYLIDGEWLYFIPLFVADILFGKQLIGIFGKKEKRKKEKKRSKELV